MRKVKIDEQGFLTDGVRLDCPLRSIPGSEFHCHVQCAWFSKLPFGGRRLSAVCRATITIGEIIAEPEVT